MNIFEIEELPKNTELIEILSESENIKIERIVSNGQTTEWIVSNEEEFVLLIQGKATIEFENRKETLIKGDTIIIKKGEKHRVAYTSKEPHCIWLCVFYKKIIR